MNLEEYSDLKISDDIDSNGGTYRNVQISGDANINGDVTCKTLTISGDGEIRGRIYCQEDFKINGDKEKYAAISGMFYLVDYWREKGLVGLEEVFKSGYCGFTKKTADGY